MGLYQILCNICECKVKFKGNEFHLKLSSAQLISYHFDMRIEWDLRNLK